MVAKNTATRRHSWIARQLYEKINRTIPQRQLDPMLDDFHRADAARTTHGSGLGLALVKSIADRHGTTITPGDNAPGFRVVVTFPAR